MSYLRLVLILVLALVSSAILANAQTQYIKNGGFETGDLTFWNVANPYGLYVNVTAANSVNQSVGGNFELAIGTTPPGIQPPINASVFVTLTTSVTVPEFSDQFTLCFFINFVHLAPANTLQQAVFTVTTQFQNGNASTLNPGFAPYTQASGPNMYTQYCLPLTAPPNNGTGFFMLGFNAQSYNGYFLVDNVTLTGPAIIVGDPQFVGLRGQSFQVHGMDGEVYNLISDKDLQVNSKFVFLTEGSCPIINGKKATNCWSHAGSYLGSIGFQQIIDGKVEQLLFTAGPAKKGYEEASLNGQAMKIGDTYTNGEFSVSFNTSHILSVDTPTFHFKFDNSDMFINQQVVAKKPLSKLTTHGLFGQTHERKIYASSLKYIAGEADDYAIADNSLFGTDFVYNRFGQ